MPSTTAGPLTSNTKKHVYGLPAGVAYDKLSDRIYKATPL
jgi:hypothetical protein